MYNYARCRLQQGDYDDDCGGSCVSFRRSCHAACASIAAVRQTPDELPGALRGYKEINLRAARLLERGGVLATFSCSYHVTESAFEATVREAATDAGVRLRVLGWLGQSADHPVVLTVPETRYLKGLLLEAC